MFHPHTYADVNMASSTPKKQPCATCGKAAGIFRCHGCEKDFCSGHVSEHRQILGKQLDEVMLEHDQLKQTISEQTDRPQLHPLMSRINVWEEQSVRKIRQTAEDTRKQLTNILTMKTTDIKKSLESLGQELTKFRHDDDFIETDLKKWTDTLNILKTEITTTPTVQIQLDHDTTSFISKLVIYTLDSSDVFDRTAGNIIIQENGEVVVKNQDQQCASVRCKNSYNTGQHRFRFKIEHSNASVWNFFGIMHKDAPIQAQIFNAATAYGWTANGYILRNGTAHLKWNGYVGGVQTNDVIELQIDCEHRTIRWTNERTKHTHTIDVDLDACNFPWQLNLCLLYSKDRIRILKNSG